METSSLTSATEGGPIAEGPTWRDGLYEKRRDGDFTSLGVAGPGAVPLPAPPSLRGVRVPSTPSEELEEIQVRSRLELLNSAQLSSNPAKAMLETI